MAIHVLAGVFWAGTAFVLARTGAALIERLAIPQIGAAVIAILAGGRLWSTTHGSTFGPSEEALAVGAGCATLALVLQVSLLPAIRRLSSLQQQANAAARARLAVWQRPIAGLLAITVAAMAMSRYV